MQVDGHTETCTCGEACDHPVAHRRTLDGWAVTGWSCAALELKSPALEAGAVAHRATVLFVADVWPVLEAVTLLDAPELGRAVLGRTLALPTPTEVRA